MNDEKNVAIKNCWKWVVPSKNYTSFQKLLLLKIASFDIHEDKCFATNQYLASAFGVTIRHIQKEIIKLLEVGIIKDTGEECRRLEIEMEMLDKRTTVRQDKRTTVRYKRTTVRQDKRTTVRQDAVLPIIENKELDLKKNLTKKSLDETKNKTNKISRSKINRTTKPKPKPKIKSKPKPKPKPKSKPDRYFLDIFKTNISDEYKQHSDFETKIITKWKYWIDYVKETHPEKYKKYNNMIIENLVQYGINEKFSPDEFIKAVHFSIGNGYKSLYSENNYQNNDQKTKTKAVANPFPHTITDPAVAYLGNPTNGTISKLYGNLQKLEEWYENDLFKVALKNNYQWKKKYIKFQYYLEEFVDWMKNQDWLTERSFKYFDPHHSIHSRFIQYVGEDVRSELITKNH